MVSLGHNELIISAPNFNDEDDDDDNDDDDNDDDDDENLCFSTDPFIKTWHITNLKWEIQMQIQRLKSQ